MTIGQESAVFDFSATPLWISMADHAEPDAVPVGGFGVRVDGGDRVGVW